MSRPALVWVLSTLFVAHVASAAAPTKAGRQVAPPEVKEIKELLAAEADKLVEVKLVQNDSRSAQIVVTNKADRPLTLKMPATFAGVPVLAQFAGPNQGGIQPGGNMAGFGAAGQPQATGGGVNQAGMGIGGGPGNGGGFCWVAREVYGESNPKWLRFRDWLTADAPRWLHDLYAAHGEAFAGWLRDKPAAKAVVRTLMDRVVVEAEVPCPASE